MGTPFRAIVMVAALIWFAPMSAAAAEPSVSLDGRPISVELAADLACHDLIKSRVVCFRTTTEMESDALELVSQAGFALASTGYVVVYENQSYGGASRTLSIDYANLATIGWNDRISSFKSFGATGYFREHANPPGGLTFTFASTSQVSYVGSTYNDKFSYFQID